MKVKNTEWFYKLDGLSQLAICGCSDCQDVIDNQLDPSDQEVVYNKRYEIQQTAIELAEQRTLK
jgi:uncharacterized protein YfcZ (UPF0381/DUF406 family)